MIIIIDLIVQFWSVANKLFIVAAVNLVLVLGNLNFPDSLFLWLLFPDRTRLGEASFAPPSSSSEPGAI